MSSSAPRVLADTNVWIAYFRGERAPAQVRPAAEALDALIVADRVVLCGVVEMELYAGLRVGEREELEAQFAALPFVETAREDFRRAGQVLGALRGRGVTIPSPDALIAALCLRHGLTLLENDGHFGHVEGLERLPWHENDSI